MNYRRHTLLVFLAIICLSSNTIGQLASLPQPGAAPYLDYQNSPIDSVNLSNGNVYVHIPLVSFPQLGDKLKLNFILRFNAPQWTVSGLSSTIDPSTGLIRYSGTWNIEDMGGMKGPPIGVDVVRDQGITAGQLNLTYICVATDSSGPGDCDDGIPAWHEGAMGPFNTTATRLSIRDRSGAEHSVAQYGVEPTGVVSQFSTAVDGSGWTPVNPNQWGAAPTAYYDRSGLKYTSVTLTNAPPGANSAAWNTTDPDGNEISTTANGWTDSVGRKITGSWTGPGSLTTTSETPEDDPIPGIPTTVLTGCNSGATAARTWTIPAVNNTTETYKFCYTPQTALTDFSVTTMDYSAAGIFENNTASELLLTQVILPNNSSTITGSYVFTYDSYFDLTSITLPTGGTISYTWKTIPWDAWSLTQPVVRAVSTRTETAGSGATPETWNYTFAATSGLRVGQVAVSVNVAKPDGNDEDHVSGFTLTDSVNYYQGHSPNNPASTTPGTLLRTDATASQILQTPFFDPKPLLTESHSSGVAPNYNLYSSPWSFQEWAIGPPLSTTVTLYNGSTSSISSTVYTPVPMGVTQWLNLGENDAYDFDANEFSGTCNCIIYGLNSSVASYDYGAPGSGQSGSLLRTTATTYKWNDGSSSAPAYLAANLLDLPSTVTVTGPLNSAETDYSYDETSYSPGGTLGDLTTVKRVNPGGVSATSHTVYNSLGIPTTLIDPNGNDTFVSSFQCSGLFPQTVLSPYQSTTTAQESTTYTYDCPTGKMTSVVDPNSVTTNYSYNDPLERLTKIDTAVGTTAENWTSYSYPDMTHFNVAHDLNSKGDQLVLGSSIYDGLGRIIHSIASNGATVDTTYDPVGRTNSVSNPYYTSNGLTYGITSYLYDGLGRKVDQCQPDNGTPNSTTCVPANSYQSWIYNGNAVIFQDESGNQWKRISDGLGRLTSVFEPSGATQTPSMETDYGYDALDNLWSVTQKGASALGIGGVVARSFSYDNLSRLVTASNPETGTVCYGTWIGSSCLGGYDANGNLQAKTDARGITTSFTYDALNRLTWKSYSNGAPAVGFGYDGKDENGNTLSPPVSNAMGRLSHSSNEVNAASNYSYDPVGRLAQEWYCTPQSCNYSNSVTASYDLAGDMTSITYPDGRLVSQGFDEATRLTSVNYTSWNGTSVASPYLAVNSYDALNHPTSWTMGTGTGATTATSAYNSRLELTSLGYAQSSATLWGKTYGWTTNGNLQTTKDSVTGVTRQFGYDTLNRLASAQDVSGASVGQATDTSDQTQTNALQNSQTLAGAGWGANNATLTPNAVAAPDGTMTAVAMVANSGSTDTYAVVNAPNPSLYDNATMTGSAWMRVPSGTLNTYITINDTGDQGYGFPGNVPVTLTTTWQQFTVTGTNQNGLTTLQLHMGGFGTVTNGQEVDIWGPQLQMSSTSSTVTNYVPYSQQIGGGLWSPYCAGNTSNMTLNTTAITAPDGSHTATSFTAPSSFSCGASGTYGAIATIPGGLTAEQTYTQSVWLRGASGGEVAMVSLNDCAGQYVTLTTSWERYVFTYANISSGVANCSTGSRGFQVLDNNDPNATFYAWGAQLEIASTAGQYVATLDSPITVNANSTNFLPSSDQVGGGGWGVRGTLVSNTTAVAAPDGSYTADAVTAPTGGGQFLDYATNAPLYDGATVTASVYLCVPAGTTLNGFYWLLEGAGGTPTTFSQTVNLTSTWQRFELTGTMQNGLTNIILALGNSATFPAGQTVYMWGAQIVTGSSAGPPIETTDTTTSDVNGSTVYLAANGLNESYSYDAFGNMLQAGNFNFVQAYTTANQLSGWSYDASGNLLNNGLGESFTYDAEGRISAVSNGISYFYDADSDRVAKAGGAATDYIYFGGMQVARLVGGQWTDLIYGPSGLLAEVPGTQTGAPVYRMLDHLGTQVGTLSSTGTVLSLTDYAPFGQVFTGGTSDPYQFTGKERDAESGNDYSGARYYSSSMGRWMSPDWSARATPVPYARLSNPQTLNLYNYVGNNPLRYFDPSGHVKCTDGKGQDVVCAVQTAWNWFKGLFHGNGGSAGGNTTSAPPPQGLPTGHSTSRIISVGAIVGPPFFNQLPGSLAGELARMRVLGVRPLSPGNPGFGAMAEQAGGRVNWTLSTEGELLTTPALDGVTHAATAGGADVLGAGTAQVATGEGQTIIFDVTAQSGHYMNGATAAQSESAIEAGTAAFGTFIDSIFRDFIPPMVLNQCVLNPNTCG